MCRLCKGSIGRGCDTFGHNPIIFLNVLCTVVIESDYVTVKVTLDLCDFHIIGDDLDGATGGDDGRVNATVDFHFASENRVENLVDCVPIVLHVANSKKVKSEKTVVALPFIRERSDKLGHNHYFVKLKNARKHRNLRRKKTF